MIDWKEKQAANRQLLEDAARDKSARNSRSVGEEIQLAGVNRARASVIAKKAVKSVENLTFDDARLAAFEYLQIHRNQTLTDDAVVAVLCKGKPPKLPKTKAERETPVQLDLLNEPPRRLHFVLPYPPSANRYWKHAAVFSGKLERWIATTYVSEEAETYKKIIKTFAKKHGIKPLLGEIRLTAYVYRPQKSGDLGNRLKVIEDALEDVAYTNDSQIAEIHLYRREDKARPRVEVFLEEIR